MNTSNNNNGRRKHSMTSFYIKTVQHHPSPFRIIPKDDQIQSQSLQNMVRMQQKEIERLEHQNRNLMILTSHQSTLLQQERQTRTRSMKSMAEIPTILDPLHTTSDKPILLQKQKGEPSASDGKLQKNFVRKIAVNRRLTWLFQKEESFKVSSILDDKISEEEAIKLYENDGSLQLLNETLNDEDSFLDILQNYPPQKVSIVYDKLRKLLSEHAIMFHTILKLKRILLNSFDISNCKILDEAFQMLQGIGTNVMECRDVQFYLIDEEKKQLYSRQTNKRVNIGEGLIGYVAQNKEVLNLKNAKYDNRFAAENLGVVLAMPILDNQKCYGVIVCQDKNQGQFQEEDEQILDLLAKQATIILTNVMSHDQLIVSINKFRHTLKSTLQFMQLSNDVDKMIATAQQRLNQMMSTDHSSIKFLDQFNDQGIMGQAAQSKQILTIQNSYNSPYFHPDIDIKTSLPVVALPIIVDDQVIGAAELMLVKGALQNSGLSSIESEVLDLFMQNLGQCLKISRVLGK